MSNLLDTQIAESNLPILCVFGGPEFLVKQFVEEHSKKFRIVIVASKKPDFLDEKPEAYFISYQNSTLLPKLHESLHYVVLFLSETSKKYTLPLLEKVKTDRSHVLVMSPVESSESFAIDLKDFMDIIHIRIAFYGEILDSAYPQEQGLLSKIIENAILKGEIRLNGNETFPVFGQSLQDLMEGISRLLFGNFRNSYIYYLFYKHPETLLESAHLIGRVEPEVKIHFSDSSTAYTGVSRKTLLKIGEKLGFSESYLYEGNSHFEELVQNFFSKKTEVFENFANRGKRKKKKQKRGGRISRFVGYSLASIFFGTFLFLFVNLMLLGVSLLLLRNSIDNLKVGNFEGVARETRIANAMLSAIKPTAELSFDLINILDSQRNIQKMFGVALRASELSEIVGGTISTLTKTPSINESSLQSTVSNFAYAFQEGQRIALDTNNSDLSHQLKSAYSKLLSFSEVLPAILGYSEPKNYLLLFQNDEELRPNGGFIGSIGDMVVSEGKVAQLSIQDVYELDGQLRNHIEPPYVVRRYLQPHLYLRDSNFPLNFQETASSAAFIYNLETTKRPDAVIAIDLEVLRQIMKITGPIELRNYNVTVTSDTVSQFIQSTIKENFFPGSTQKKDVLNALLTELTQRSTSDPSFYGALIKLLPELLENKNIQVSFSDTSVQKLFSANGYAGEHLDRRAIDPRKIQDYLYINEANIGVNKANAHISREVYYRAMVGQGKLTSRATLTLTNVSPQDSYKTFVRFTVPKGSILRQVLINDVKQTITPAITDFQIYEASNFSPPEGLEVEQSQKDNLTTFAFIVDAKRGEKTKIEIEYDNGAVKALQTIATYSLLYIKQPGTKPYNITASIDYPEGYTPVDTSADSYGKNFLEETKKISKDYILEIELQRRQ